MAVRRVSGRWVVEFMQAGHRVFKRLPEEASRQDALDYETKLRREIFDQATLGKRPEIALEYAIKEWLREVNEGRKSAKATESHARRVAKYCDGIGVNGIADVAGAIRGTEKRGKERNSGVLEPGKHEDKPRNAGGNVGKRIQEVGEGLAAGTVNRRLCILKAVAKYAWRKGWTEENLSARIQTLPENNARHFYLTSEQVSAVIEATPERSRCFVGLGVYTGIRQGQIVALKPEDVIGGAIRLPDSKGGQPLLVPVVEPAKPYLAGIPFKLHKRTHYKDFKNALIAIGLGHLTYHDLRHTTASLMIQAGADLYTVGEILGHKCVQTTKRYAHLAEGNKRKALQGAFPHQNPITPYEVNEDK